MLSVVTKRIILCFKIITFLNTSTNVVFWINFQLFYYLFYCIFMPRECYLLFYNCTVVTVHD